MRTVHTHPVKSALRAWLEAPVVLLTVLYLHPRNGFRYAYYWARQSIMDRELGSPVADSCRAADWPEPPPPPTFSKVDMGA